MPPCTCSLAPQMPSIEELIQKAKTFVAAAKAPATLKAYRNDWRDFESWCRNHQLPSLPSTPETVALYIADRASTLAQALSGAVSPRSPRHTRQQSLRIRRPRPATSSSARLSKESGERSAPRSAERTRFSGRTSAESSPPGART